MPPPPKPPPKHWLDLTTTSLRNTTAADASDKYYYEIRTPRWEPQRTRINKLDQETRALRCVAEIERRKKGYGTKVRFLKDQDGDAQGLSDDTEGWMPLGEWLKYDPSGVGGTFADASGQQYRWKTHNRHLQLVRADDEDKKVIARYHPCVRYLGVLRMRKHPCLELDSSLVESGILERIIVSYLFVESRRRSAHIRIKLEHA